VLLTGALHLDGFMDACDGLFSHRSTEERLRIMRDVHVGAWGVIGVVLLLLVKAAALTTMPAHANVTSALLLAPMLARWAISASVILFPYGRAEGWGKTLKQNAGHRQLLLATISALTIALLVSVTSGLMALLLAFGAMLLIARFALDRLAGLTGDVYGMIAEIVEVVVLLVFALRFV
jgi:adenosylcobinamide-GDP ribazoletransferase